MTVPSSAEVLAELRRLEPIFHTREFGTTVEDFDRRMAAEYWEIGASGRRYSREFILREFAQRPPVLADEAGWQCSDHAVQQLSAETFLLTYALDQAGRLTRRATIWQRHADAWQIVYHQGTLAMSSASEIQSTDSDGLTPVSGPSVRVDG